MQLFYNNTRLQSIFTFWIFMHKMHILLLASDGVRDQMGSIAHLICINMIYLWQSLMRTFSISHSFISKSNKQSWSPHTHLGSVSLSQLWYVFLSLYGVHPFFVSDSVELCECDSILKPVSSFGFHKAAAAQRDLSSTQTPCCLHGPPGAATGSLSWRTSTTCSQLPWRAASSEQSIITQASKHTNLR